MRKEPAIMSSMASDSKWVAKKPPQAPWWHVCCTPDLGFYVPPSPSQKQFSELLMKAAGDYEALTEYVADFQWSQNFKELPSVWGEMLQPIPVALAACTRFFEAMSAMKESFAFKI